MKVPICLILIMQLTACIPIGIQGTSLGDAGTQRPAACLSSGANATIDPEPHARAPQRA
jgi:hypothetical protein